MLIDNSPDLDSVLEDVVTPGSRSITAAEPDLEVKDHLVAESRVFLRLRRESWLPFQKPWTSAMAHTRVGLA